MFVYVYVCVCVWGVESRYACLTFRLNYILYSRLKLLWQLTQLWGFQSANLAITVAASCLTQALALCLIRVCDAVCVQYKTALSKMVMSHHWIYFPPYVLSSPHRPRGRENDTNEGLPVISPFARDLSVPVTATRDRHDYCRTFYYFIMWGLKFYFESIR